MAVRKQRRTASIQERTFSKRYWPWNVRILG